MTTLTNALWSIAQDAMQVAIMADAPDGSCGIALRGASDLALAAWRVYSAMPRAQRTITAHAALEYADAALLIARARVFPQGARAYLPML